MIAPVVRALRKYHPEEDIQVLQRAFEVANRHHRGQKRKSGDPYITHPVAVTAILAEMGATGPNAYDCSGLTTAAYRSVGVSLPRTSQAQYRVGTPVSLSNLQPGDLVFYYSGISHVGIYIGNGRIVHAANPRSGVTTASVTSMPFMGGRRVA